MHKEFDMITPMEDGPDSYLRAENNRLRELIERYNDLSIPAVSASRWSRDYIDNEVNLKEFRGDCAYVWQLRDGNQEHHHVVTALYTQSIDTLGLFNLLQEDSAFGALVHSYNDRYTISRDFLDSINEILFLERHLKVSTIDNLNVLDIGAGYGRLAHRMAVGLPNLGHVYCVDAIPESTFLSEYYLHYRGVADKAHAIPIYNIEDALEKNSVQLATNIHSFSECTLESITWWLDLLARHSVKYLMIEPNAGTYAGEKLVSFELDKHRIDYSRNIESRGYKLIAREPTYLNPSVQKLGVSPTYYYLFELIE